METYSGAGAPILSYLCYVMVVALLYLGYDAATSVLSVLRAPEEVVYITSTRRGKAPRCE
jgi:hypothetical protein